MTPKIIGRFAPSPTGHLHLGSLMTALASHCHAKAQGGEWHIRIEDTDFERCKPEFATQILKDLEQLGLGWDGAVIYQSKRLDIYQDALHTLKHRCYPCDCSRKQLANFGVIYPRFCLHKTADHNQKWRLVLPDMNYAFFDEYQGIQWQNPQKTLGDVVIKRQNGMINYILACAVDDGLMGINSLVRGLDILPMTITQILIQNWLKLPTPHQFAHLPLLTNGKQKLSKQNLATPIDTQHPSAALIKALQLLGMPTPSHLANDCPANIIDFAIHHWQGDWQQAIRGKQEIIIQ